MHSKIDIRGKLGIIGAGGLGKEVLCCIGEQLGWKNLHQKIKFLVEERYYQQKSVLGIDVIPFSVENHGCELIVVAIGDLKARLRIIEALSNTTQFATIIHPSVQLTPYTHIGQGSIVLGNSLLSCDVHIGRHAIINPGTTISHDTQIGDYFTSSPGVNISGNCTIGDRVFFGTNACIRDARSISNDVIIGMGAVVVKDISRPGTYIGNPASFIQNE